jgi:hypothetical protein
MGVRDATSTAYAFVHQQDKKATKNNQVNCAQPGHVSKNLETSLGSRNTFTLPEAMTYYQQL